MDIQNYIRDRSASTNEQKYNFPTELPLRPGLNTQGQQIQVRVNQYKVTQWPQNDIYQYDVIREPLLFQYYELIIP
jgi:hypothetical protein